jgi:hypothetical protein
MTRVLLLSALALLLSPAAWADLFTAQLAYDKGDYQRAFHDYRELAELGQPVAQFNLAIMYAKGMGISQSDIHAYAWASLAVENGQPGAKSLADKLRSQLAPGSEKIADDIAAPYRRAALETRLMPKIEDDQGTAGQCRPVKIAMPTYPLSASFGGIQGNVLAEFTVMPDGSGRNPRIVTPLSMRSTNPRAGRSCTPASRSELQENGRSTAICCIALRHRTRRPLPIRSSRPSWRPPTRRLRWAIQAQSTCTG